MSYDFKYNNYFKSLDVRVFPCAYRGQKSGENPYLFNPESRGFTEYNFSNIYSKPGLTKNSFLISWDQTTGKEVLKCVIAGYYFEIYNITPADLNNKILAVKLTQVNFQSENNASNEKTYLLSSWHDDDLYLDYTVEADPRDSDYAFTGIKIFNANDDIEEGVDKLALVKDGEIISNARRLDDLLGPGEGASSLRSLSTPEATSAGSIAIGEGSIALGLDNKSYNESNITLGKKNTAGTNNSETEGTNIAIGSKNIAKNGSIAIGSDLNANGQVVLGKKNKEDNDAAFILGYGDTTADNLLTVSKTGDLNIKSNLSAINNTFSVKNEQTTQNGIIDNANILTLGVAGTRDNPPYGKVIIYGKGSGYKNLYIDNAETIIGNKITSKDTLTVNEDITGLKNLILGKDEATATASTITVYGTGTDPVLSTDANGTITSSGLLKIKGQNINDDNESSIASDLNVIGQITAGNELVVNKNNDNENNIVSFKNEGITLNKSTNIYAKLTAHNGADIYSNGTVNIDGIAPRDGTNKTGGNLKVFGSITGNEFKLSGENPAASINTDGVITGTNLVITNILSIDENNNLDLDTNGLKAGTILLDNINIKKETITRKDIDGLSSLSNKSAISVGTGGHFKGNLTLTHKIAKTENADTSNGETTEEYLGGDFAIYDSTKVTTKINNAGTAYFAQKLIIGGTKESLGDGVDEDTGASATLEAFDGYLWADDHRLIAKNKIIAESLDINSDVKVGGSIEVANGLDLKKGSVVIAEGNLSVGGEATANSYNALSDIRLKQNIIDFKCNKSILDLPIKAYEYIDDSLHAKHIGCIAQDLQEICPEIVHENVNGYLTIEENKLVYLLLQEVKQLKEEIKELKK